MNGKSDRPRNCFSKQFKSNYDSINWGRPKTIDEVCGVPKGTFKHNLKEQSEQLNSQEKARQKRLRKSNKDKTVKEPECEHCGRIYCDCETKY
jgi:hypothetical protein